MLGVDHQLHVFVIVHLCLPKNCEEKLQDARDVAMHELEQRAQTLGADAVVGVDLDYEVVADSMLMVSVSGTAVTLE